MERGQGMSSRRGQWLFLDLDGTLADTDLLIESLVRCLRSRPLLLLLFPIWLLAGRARAKARLAGAMRPDLGLVPLNPHVVDLARQWKRAGGRVAIASASDSRLVAAIGERLDFVDATHGSREGCNLKGRTKLELIQRLAGGRPFAYCGDSRADLPILQAASSRFVVPRSTALLRRLRRDRLDHSCIPFDRPTLTTLVKALRLHQWVKNVLLFLPMLAAHQWSDVQGVASLGLAFLAFGLVASATYVLNDLLDIENDRLHPRKRLRPVAAGRLQIVDAIRLALTCGFAGIGLAWVVGTDFLAMLALYVVATLAYSAFLKRYVLIDVFALAGLYTLRVLTGAVVTDIRVSFWLLAFSMALFISLALIKRCAELEALRETGREETAGRNYRAADLGYLVPMGIAGGYAAVLLLALYVDTSAAHGLYAAPERLWLACPFLLYWISRLWIKTTRGEMHDDPIVFTFRNRGSMITLLLAGACFASALVPA